MDRIIKPPVRCPSIVHQHAKAVRQDTMRLRPYTSWISSAARILKERLEKTIFFIDYVEAPYASFLNLEDPMGNNICLYEPC